MTLLRKWIGKAEKRRKTSGISYFDNQKFFDASPDIADAIARGGLRDISDFFIRGGIEEIRTGKRRFHVDFEPFDSERYLLAFPDVKLAVERKEFASAMEHFRQFGYAEIIAGRRKWKRIGEQAALSDAPCILPGILRLEVFERFLDALNEKRFFEANPDIGKAVEEGDFASVGAHLETAGMRELYRGDRQLYSDTGVFEESSYLSDNNEVPFLIKGGAYLSAFEHYLLHMSGIEEDAPGRSDRQPANVFDREYYKEQNPDVAEAGVDPYAHYIDFGEKEGRCPNAFFDPAFYYRLNADVRVAGLSAFQHFCEAGFDEGRLSMAPVNVTGKRTEFSKALLFVGHDGIQAGSEIVLLEVIKWFHIHTNRKIKLLLLAPGPVANRYAYYADVYSLAEHKVDQPEKLKAFLAEPFEFAYLNTVVSGKLFSVLEGCGITLGCDIVTHIHEMEKVLSEYEGRMQALIPRTSVWISASPSSSETLVKKYGLPKEKVVTVEAFIAPVATDQEQNLLQVKARKALGLALDVQVVTGCGTLNDRKGPDLFVKAAKSVNAERETPCHFVWIGDGPDRAKLEAGLDEKERSYIHFAGNRSDANVLLAAGDIFFLSSREDPFPLVVLESAQHNIPAVCFAPATGITAFIESDAGVAVNTIDASEAAAALSELLDDDIRREMLGRQARRKLFDTYTSERQNARILETIRKHTSYTPSVSVIVPFYNHEAFIEERIGSVLRQNNQDFEIILLDDCSSDATVSKTEPYLADDRFRLIRNEVNSGSPFKQWEKGVALARAEIVWIAEGDDTCTVDFIQTLLPYFNDPMVNIAAAKTEIINEHGVLVPRALDPYLQNAYPEKFGQSFIRDGFREVNEQFGAVSTLVNASALLIRKSSFGETLKEAQHYKIAGDWLIYLECLRHGKLAYDVRTTNFFRRHSTSQVHKTEGGEVYFQERRSITKYVFEHFAVTPHLVRKAFAAVDGEWERFKSRHPEGTTLESLYDKNALLTNARIIENKYHAAFYIHGMLFSKGGIERLAMQLGNFLAEQGWKVTIYCRVHISKTPVYPLYDGIAVVPLFDEVHAEASVKKMRRHMLENDVDVFVPMLSEWLFDPVVEAASMTGIPIVVSEHNDPWKIEELWWSHEERIKCFGKAEKIHLLLKKYAESLPKSLREYVTVIPNGISMPKSPMTQERKKRIISVGRLEKQKRFDRFVDAVASIKKPLREAGYTVEIFGEGSLEQELKKQIKRYDIEDLVLLKGRSSQIETEYEKADFFVLPSDFEGLPLTLLEAFSHGLPSIAFGNCNGPNEIISNRQDGFLVSDTRELGKVLVQMIWMSEKEKEAMRLFAVKKAEQYTVDKILKQWHELLLHTVKVEQRSKI